MHDNPNPTHCTRQFPGRPITRLPRRFVRAWLRWRHLDQTARELRDIQDLARTNMPTVSLLEWQFMDRRDALPVPAPFNTWNELRFALELLGQLTADGYCAREHKRS